MFKFEIEVIEIKVREKDGGGRWGYLPVVEKLKIIHYFGQNVHKKRTTAVNKAADKYRTGENITLRWNVRGCGRGHYINLEGK